MSYIRILQASPDAPAVDIYANDSLFATDLSYEDFTDYLPMPEGSYNTKAYATGTRTTPIVNANLDLPRESIITAAVVGKLGNTDLLAISDPLMTIPPGKVMLRFAHLSPDASSVDLILPDGTVLFSNVGYRGVTGYIPVDPATYTLQVRLAGARTQMLTVPNATLVPGRFYTVYLVGLTASAAQPLQVLIPLDGNSYINFKHAAGQQLRVYAAASVTNAMNEIKMVYASARPEVTLALTYGGSGRLQQQIEQGATADVFISASPDQANTLQSSGLLLEGTRRNLFSNRVVLVVPSGSMGINDFKDLAGARVKKIAIGNPASVPAGKYAQEVFAYYGIQNQVTPKLALYGDVRQVLASVESGQVDAGVVYATDALAATNIKTVAVAPELSHSQIIYPVAVIRSSINANAAKEFENFLFNDQARAVFGRYGFIVI